MRKIYFSFLIFVLMFSAYSYSKSFEIYNVSNPSQTYFIVNGQTGYVGVGTNTPGYPLDVVGTGYFSGNLYVSGNIGIGTTSPTHKLEIAGNVNLNENTLYIKDVSGSKYGIGYGVEGGSELTLFSDNIITFTESDSDVVRAIWSMNEPYFNFDSGTLYINGTSNMVGVGTTSPSYKLHVAGDIYSSGTIYEQGSSLSSRYINEGQTAGGDLSGTYPNPTVAKIQGRPVSSTSPSTNQALVWDGSQWTPTSVDLSSTNELQNIWSTISVPSGSNPVPDSTSDTLTLSAGAGISISGDASTDTITISNTGDTNAGDDVTDSDITLDANNRIYIINVAGTDREIRSNDLVCTNCVALGSETTGNYVAGITAGTGISVSGTAGEGWSPTISVKFGSTSGTAAEGNKQITITAGSGLSGGGTVTIGSGGTVTISHADTSSQSSVDNSGNTFIQDITLDTYGHVTGITSGTVSESDPQVATTTSGRVCYGTGSAVTCNDNLYWDSSNDRLAVGTTSASSRLYVYAPDTAIADIYAVGLSQGTGMVYVGQSTSYGGGIVYNGDDNPDLPFTTDAISFFRRSDGTDYEVFYFMHNSNTVYFNGDINMKDHNILDANTLTVNTIYDPEDAYLSISDHVYFTVNGTRIYLKSKGGQTQAGIYTTSDSNRLFIRAENTDNVAQFASYGLWLPRDVDTGLYVTGGMRVNYGGSEFVVDNSGNVNADSGTFYVDAANNRVGVGTTSPSEKLDVSGGIKASYFTDGTSRSTSFWGSSADIAVNSVIYTAGILHQGETGGSPAGITFGNGNTEGNDQISLITNGATRLYINSGGNVGIGTTSPAKKLDVNGEALIRSKLYFDSSGNSQIYWDSANNRLVIQVA